MSRKCCKGCYTIQCEFCYCWICPTNGHNQRFQIGNKDACEDCKNKIDWKPNRKTKNIRNCIMN